MAADSRRQLPVLIGLVVVLAAVGWWQFGSSGTPAAPAAARRAQPPARRGAAASPDQVLVRGVGLDRLDEDRPAPEEGGRDPFRSGPSASAGQGTPGPARPAAPVVPTPVVPVGPVVPAGPPPPPPITVKFIGVVSRQDVGKVAVLSDGKNVYYGRAGEIVDGRWRIVSIGEESLQIEYADGRGRQTVRMTG
ncbi:hypothetical protein [Luteitalea sp.]|uniref:hypothetical protein n=1 Tax=Luteitalea sp. TaxID=2004800 RepID=UPI000A70E201|nr:hypothetical protein [Luteitalea sp.]